MKNNKFAYIFLSFFSIIALCFSFITPHINKYAGATYKPTLTNNYTYNNSWSSISFNGLSSFDGYLTWTDGSNIFYSNEENGQYVLDKSTNTWSAVTWSGYPSALGGLMGSRIWTDGIDIYVNDGTNWYVLDKVNRSWSIVIFGGTNSFSNTNIWTDGNTIFLSSGNSQYILDVPNRTWIPTTWTYGDGVRASYFTGLNVWTDGVNFYVSRSSNQYIIDIANKTVNLMSWSGLTSYFGSNIWYKGNDVMYSSNANQYILDKSTNTWASFTWENLTSFNASNIWTDGVNIYYSSSSTQYVLFGTEYVEEIGNYPRVMPSIVDAFVGGIVGFAGMIGGAFNNLADTLFFETINDNVGLSAFGTLAFSFLGLTIALSFAKYVIKFIVKKGDYYCEK